MRAARFGKPLLGLDVSPSSVKLVELSRRTTGWRLESYARVPLPAHAVGSEKTVADADAVGAAIAQAVRSSATRLRDAAVAMPGDAAITQVLQLPAGLPSADFEDRVELLAERSLPLPRDDLRFDYAQLGACAQQPGALDVLLVAARREHVEQLAAAVRRGGLRPRLVDVEPFALRRACLLLGEQLPHALDGRPPAVALADCGAQTTAFTVLDGSGFAHTRDFACGGRQLTGEIQHRYGLPWDEAEAAKKSGALPGDYVPQVLRPFVARWAQQIARCVQFFVAAGVERAPPATLLLGGGSAALPGLAAAVAEHAGIPVAIADPLARMELSARASGAGAAAEASALLTACGLALRGLA